MKLADALWLCLRTWPNKRRHLARKRCRKLRCTQYNF